MSLINTYNLIPYDIAGSMSKNRFRQEILWGVSKMFDLFDKSNFCVVFDYKCDIEVHLDDSLELYQIKTHKIQTPYKFTELSKIGDKKNSIIAKLFLLQDITNDDMLIKCALVSNAFLQVKKKTFSEFEMLDFSNLDDDSQLVIKRALQSELSRDVIDLCNISYIYTSMDLVSPEDAIKGKITGSFERIKGCEPVKPNALCRLIIDTAKEKACYEFVSQDYDDLIRRKGITKTELNFILDKYKDETNNSVEQIKEHIEKNYPSARNRKKLKSALVKIVEAEYNSRELQSKEKQNSAYILECESSGTVADSIEEIADDLILQFGEGFPIEYSKEEVFVFMLLIIKRWEDGRYE